MSSFLYLLVTGNISEVISLVPEIERLMNYSFDITKLFSSKLASYFQAAHSANALSVFCADRETFVKFGVLLCGHPFPSTESIPLVNDILYSEDFSEVNDVELQAMPSKCVQMIFK